MGEVGEDLCNWEEGTIGMAMGIAIGIAIGILSRERPRHPCRSSYRNTCTGEARISYRNTFMGEAAAHLGNS